MDLFADGGSPAGRAIYSLVLVVAAAVVAAVAGRLAARRVDDAYTRYHVRKAVRYAVAVVAFLVLLVIWRPFAGRIGVVLGLTAAGVAFAMQEVIGAVAGWFNIVSGRIYRVGDRVQVAGVRGDVVDITPLRTKILEIGSSTDEQAWVRGRQLTGRVVAVSNKSTFTEPVFNYSAAFEHIWEELTVPVALDADWRAAEEIMLDEARAASASQEAREAIDAFSRRYPVPRADLEPRVFVRATDNWMELSARFIVPVRTARSVKDELTRRVHERFEAAGIAVASETVAVTLHRPERPPPGEGPGA